MKKNTIIGVSLIILIYIAWGWWLSEKTTENPQNNVVSFKNDAEIVENVGKEGDTVLKELNPVLTEDSIKISFDTVGVKQKYLKDVFGSFAGSAAENGDKRIFTIETDKFKLNVSNVGAQINYVDLKKYVTYDSLPLVLFDSVNSKFELVFSSGTKVLSTSDLIFEPVFYGKKSDDNYFKIENGDSLVLGFRLYPDIDFESKNKNSYIEYLYTIYGNENMLDFDIRFNNIGNFIDQSSLTIYWNEGLNRNEMDLKDELANSTIFYKFKNERGAEELSMGRDEKERLTTDVKWISYKNKFFVSTLIADDCFSGATVEAITEKSSNPNYLRTMSTEARPMFSDNNVIGMKWYFGANDFKELSKYDLDLERQVPIGWGFFLMAWINKYVIINVFDWLSNFGWSYGIIILILTILLKIVLFPFTYKTYISSAKMRLLKPEVDDINKKYPKPEDAMKKQQATMTLYKKAGASPMAGCLPSLLQFPILIAMFRFFPSAIELRQQHFLWVKDLSTYDSIWNFGFNIPFYGDHVSLLCLLMAASMIISTVINSSSTPNNNMPGMKFMMYAMPVLFIGIFNNYSAALSYYYLLVNIISIIQIYVMRLIVNEDKLHKQMEANKKKPVKKSSWSQRLEQMQKQQAQLQKTKKR